MTDCAEGSDLGTQIIGEMDDAGVLHIRSFSNADCIDVCPEDGIVENTGVPSQVDVTEDGGVPCHKCGFLCSGQGTEKSLQSLLDIHDCAASLGHRDTDSE